MDEGRFALTILGQWLRNEDPLSGIIRQLGLGGLPHDQFLTALDAAGERTGARVLLLIDAINESERPGMWAEELPALLARVAPYPHVAVGVSCRSTYTEIALPEDVARLPITQRTHHGFFGHEVEALERYLADIPHVLPRTPLLIPDFSNPLFIKLYAQGYEHLDSFDQPIPPPTATTSRTEVFERFIANRARRIEQRLGLDPASRIVQHAIEAVAARMAETGRDTLPRSEADKLVNQLAPHLTRWPDTLFGALLSEGLLAAERAFHGEQPTEGVAFPYQAFTDHLIVSGALARHQADLDAVPTGGALPADAPLRSWLLNASYGLLLAASIVVPETTGRELFDLLGLTPPGTSSRKRARPPRTRQRAVSPQTTDEERVRSWLLRHLPDSVTLRAPQAVTDRTVHLLDVAIAEERIGQEAWTAILAVAAEPAHPLNAAWLHTRLAAFSLAQRDAWWGQFVYDSLDAPGPVLRLVRWSELLPTPITTLGDGHRSADSILVATSSQDDQVAELVAIALAWLTSSPNRFLRDRATKALVQVLLSNPTLSARLLRRFATVDDRYVQQRVLLAAYGLCLRAGHVAATTPAITELAHTVLSVVFAPDGLARTVPDILVRDAAAGIIDYAVWRGLLAPSDAAPAHSPYGAPKPGNPPSTATLETRYPRDRSFGDGYSSLHASILTGLADFGRYVIDRTVRHIARVGLAKPHPGSTRDRRRVNRAAVKRFLASLPPDRQAALRADRSQLEQLLQTAPMHAFMRSVAVQREPTDTDELTNEQLELAKRCITYPEPAPTISDEWARRWVFQRVISLGWNPDRFGSFDRPHSYDPYSHTTHKRERFGKKYAWIALHELTARLVDQYHLNTQADDDPQPTYHGAWQLDCRDLDPSLPPAPHPLTSDEDDPLATEAVRQRRLHTYQLDVMSPFWAPAAPELPDPHDADDWIASDIGLPDLSELTVRTDEDGVHWVVLYSTVAFDRPRQPRSSDLNHSDARVQQWHHLYTWLVHPKHAEALVDFLDNHTLMNDTMPNGRDTVYPDQVYLGELPWAPASRYWDNILGEPPTRLATVHDHASPVDAHNEQDRSGWTQIGALREAGVRVLPAWQSYAWSGDGLDCSLDADVSINLPASVLLGVDGDIVLHPAYPDVLRWPPPSGTPPMVVARSRQVYADGRRLTALLAQEDWLLERLEGLGLDLVAGLLGERQVITGGPPRHWMVMDQVGHMPAPGSWRFRSSRARHESRDTDQ